MAAEVPDIFKKTQDKREISPPRSPGLLEHALVREYFRQLAQTSDREAMVSKLRKAALGRNSE